MTGGHHVPTRRTLDPDPLRRPQGPAQCAKVLYPLTEILLLALEATVAGADDFVEVTLWGEQHRPSSAALSHI